MTAINYAPGYNGAFLGPYQKVIVDNQVVDDARVELLGKFNDSRDMLRVRDRPAENHTVGKSSRPDLGVRKQLADAAIQRPRVIGHDDLDFIGNVIAVPDRDRGRAEVLGLDQQLFGRGCRKPDHAGTLDMGSSDFLRECQGAR